MLKKNESKEGERSWRCESIEESLLLEEGLGNLNKLNSDIITNEVSSVSTAVFIDGDIEYSHSVRRLMMRVQGGSSLSASPGDHGERWLVGVLEMQVKTLESSVHCNSGKPEDAIWQYFV